MITTSRQNWSINSIVRVGFLRLRVIAVIPTPANHEPDQYALESLDGTRWYRFTPHLGIHRVDTRANAIEPTF
jgi:hypothetical protein